MPTAPLFTARQQAENFLLKHKQDGWFSYHIGRSPSIEATAWCAIALAGRPDVKDSVMAFFRRSQGEDGGWSTSPGAGGSDWCTSLALVAQRVLSPASTNEPWFRRGVEFLMKTRADIYPFLGRMFFFVLRGRPYARGWPWNPDCYDWVEPTSYAILALAPLAAVDHDIKEAVGLAQQAIIARSCYGGGWNLGNNMVLGALLPPYPVTTAQALIALQNHPKLPAVVAALSYLKKGIENQDTAMTLSWAIMAADALDQDTSEQLTRLISLQNSDGSFGNNLYLTGLAACALRTMEKNNPLKISFNS